MERARKLARASKARQMTNRLAPSPRSEMSPRWKLNPLAGSIQTYCMLCLCGLRTASLLRRCDGDFSGPHVVAGRVDCGLASDCRRSSGRRRRAMGKSQARWCAWWERTFDISRKWPAECLRRFQTWMSRALPGTLPTARFHFWWKNRRSRRRCSACTICFSRAIRTGRNSSDCGGLSGRSHEDTRRSCKLPIRSRLDRRGPSGGLQLPILAAFDAAASVASGTGSMMCRPHSVLANPGQRPARGSSPGRTARVQCVQPMLG